MYAFIFKGLEFKDEYHIHEEQNSQPQQCQDLKTRKNHLIYPLNTHVMLAVCMLQDVKQK